MVDAKQRMQTADNKHMPCKVNHALRAVTVTQRIRDRSVSVAIITCTVALTTATVCIWKTAFPRAISDAPTDNKRRLSLIHIYKNTSDTAHTVSLSFLRRIAYYMGYAKSLQQKIPEGRLPQTILLNSNVEWVTKSHDKQTRNVLIYNSQNFK